jgi:hypothetical protein
LKVVLETKLIPFYTENAFFQAEIVKKQGSRPGGGVLAIQGGDEGSRHATAMSRRASWRAGTTQSSGSMR